MPYLGKRLRWPSPEPVHHAAVEQRRRGCTPTLEAFGRRVHREHHVQPALNLPCRVQIGRMIHQHAWSTFPPLSSRHQHHHDAFIR